MLSEWYTSASPARLYAGPSSSPDRYTLEEVVSQGMEGRLWRASLAVDGHRFQVAVKEIHQRNVSSLPEWLQRWERQAELLRSLDHPGLIRVREVFQGAPAHSRGVASDGERSLFLVMNWANGLRLDEWIVGRDRDERLAVLGHVAAAVDHLHSGQDTSGVAVLHRDIKPQNIVIDDNGRPRLVDFGFARLADGTDYTVVGSLNYMAPEIPLGAVPTPAADRYSFGCLAFSMLTDQRVSPADRASMEASVDLLGSEGVSAQLCTHLLLLLGAQPIDRPGDLAPWRERPDDAGGEIDAGPATVVRQRGWIPPVVVPSLEVSTEPMIVTPSTLPPAGPSTLPLGSASPVYPTSVPVWPPITPTSMTPTSVNLSVPPVGIPTGDTTLSPASYEGSQRHWSSAVGIGLVVAALMIAGVAAAIWVTRSPSTTKPSETATTLASTTTSSSTTTSTTTVPAVTVADVVGRDRRDAEAALAQQGLSVVVQYQEDRSAGETVLAITPASGTALPSGSEVRLSVSSPTFTMPDLRGLSLSIARAELSSRGLVPAYLSVDPSSAAGSAIVMAQVPAAAAAQPKGQPVTVVVVEPVVTAPTASTTTSVVLAPPTSQP